MVLFTNEHNLIKKEFDLINNLKFEEEKEREMLSLFSENIRKSHQVFCQCKFILSINHLVDF